MNNTDTQTDQNSSGRERVVFSEAYDEMADKLEVLVGDHGFVVQASRQFTSDGRVLVQFDENRTGRPGGERHWIPKRCLQPESDRPEADLDE